ncbi:MAG TPA: RidA family protein [Candidatus Binatia bacterium]|jgi:enamine deaminase RidA (YjgF/YER057c/UK114 family)|nr:RidA family protein [Candidatus Binatia bacterium]
MKGKPINPWNWQDQLGFSQAIEVSGAQRTIYCAGQASVDAEGNPINKGDMVAQVNQALDNLEKVLRQAGLELGNVVRLNYYTTNVSRFLEAGLGPITGRLAKAGCAPAATLLGVASLFHPDAMIEIEATAIA